FGNGQLTPILPFLYLGNEHDAQDLHLLQRMNIGYILNVTTHLPLYHYDTGLFNYKRLPATDSNKQNLRQYFEEAFEFIAHQAGMGLLIHCQAGVSRSATIVIAYLMKHSWMTMTDAYKFVKSKRPIISPNLNFMGQLLEFEEDLNNGITPRILTRSTQRSLRSLLLLCEPVEVTKGAGVCFFLKTSSTSSWSLLRSRPLC
uniref:protein-tyrosine-phosphatase n=1 Tax=Xiphophorus couchianus TaxID=32473 RepID=A0A3B5KXU5_9TELE